ncbi:MAG TPA: S-adenosyl-L-methionine--L-histidine 3-amino-3-carboxypropyltransferase, partial [Methanothermococcus okinawensis]|nr:S-adenosyl-L-methionine--L-histidine 3-amino-3-carboxypropyltransferase [Methanothermococcus okinawensis]
MWDLEKEKVIREILRHKGKRILFQAPEGLKLNVEREIDSIKRYFKDRGWKDMEFIMWGGSAFGACDICDKEGKYLNVDLIIHYGHEELPYVRSE